VVRGEFVERTDEGGLKNPDEPLLFELHRTETALAGVMRSTQANCPVEYGIDVVSCGQNLQATVEVDVQVGPDCKRIGEAHRTAFVFVPDALHPSGGGDGPDAH